MCDDEMEHKADYSHDTWMSLLGLLHPSEFFVTVDHSTSWRKHLAWSKPNGQDLRNYTTQCFSSNMVFMSLILGTEISFLFNSSDITTDIRTQMRAGNYISLRYWIGFFILLSACVTVIALVCTHTSWGLINAIGDNNTHCLLRSSIGQYVCSLPSNFAVAALYLFLVCLILFIVELMTGPLQAVLVVVVLYLFFQVVTSLSAFGRLIIHTGAMSNTPVLDPVLERALLPSGLHASLLIKATDRKRRQTSVVSMYRSPDKKTKAKTSCYSQRNMQQGNASFSQHSFRSRNSDDTFASKRSGKRKNTSVAKNREDEDVENLYHVSDYKSDHSESPTQSCTESSRQSHNLVDSEEDDLAIMNAMKVFSSKPVPIHPILQSDRSSATSSNDVRGSRNVANVPTQITHGSDAKLYQENDEPFADFRSFPRVSVLNRSNNSNDLKKIVEEALSTRSNRDTDLKENIETDTTPIGSGHGKVLDKVRFSIRQSFDTGEAGAEEGIARQGNRRSAFATAKALSRRSLLGGFRQVSTRKAIQEEWKEEEDVRNMYDIAPPAEVVFENDGELWEDSESDSDSDVDDDNKDDLRMPHPHILNQVRRLPSLRRLVKASSLDAISQSPRDSYNQNSAADVREASERSYLLSKTSD